MYPGFKYPEWQKPLQAAVLEFDPQPLRVNFTGSRP
jgi:hypothetical protein